MPSWPGGAVEVGDGPCKSCPVTLMGRGWCGWRGADRDELRPGQTTALGFLSESEVKPLKAVKAGVMWSNSCLKTVPACVGNALGEVRVE